LFIRAFLLAMSIDTQEEINAINKELELLELLKARLLHRRAFLIETLPPVTGNSDTITDPKTGNQITIRRPHGCETGEN